jgi:NADPH:quinone reductase-like Zn-dependent oxidoreductase
MKAIQFDTFGGPEVLCLADVPAPVPGTGEVLVEVHAASVNPADCKGRAGAYGSGRDVMLPHIPGRDFSGVVVAVGPGVTDFKPGDEVYGIVEADKESTQAEMAVVSAAIVAPKARNLSHIEMAAVALGALTALIALDDTARLKQGETVLVHGGAGGVGGMGVQIGRHLGAHVIATASARNHDYVKSLGAHEMIDYAREDFTKMGRRCDVVFDTVGGTVQARSPAVLKPGGRLCFVARGPKDFAPPGDIRVLRPNVTRERRHLERVAALVEKGAIRPPAIETMPLADAAQAHVKSETGHVRGKIVFAVR